MRISDWSSDVCSSDLGQTEGFDARLVAEWPKAGMKAWGLAQHASGLLVLWDGHARVLIVDPATGAIREAEPKGEAARAMRDAKRPGKVYSKWRYVDRKRTRLNSSH